MKTSSCKAKGRRLVQQIKQKLLETFPELQDDDIVLRGTSTPGEDLVLSPRARSLFPFSVEAKNTEKLNIWAAIKQSKQNSGNYKPAVVFSRNHEEAYIVVKLDDFLAQKNAKI